MSISHLLDLQTVLVELGLVHTTHVPQFSVFKQPGQLPQRFLLTLFTVGGLLMVVCSFRGEGDEEGEGKGLGDSCCTESDCKGEESPGVSKGESTLALFLWISV